MVLDQEKTVVPLSSVISKGALGAQVKMWRDRMEVADIAVSYMLLRNLSLSGNYSSQFGWAAGLDIKF